MGLTGLPRSVRSERTSLTEEDHHGPHPPVRRTAGRCRAAVLALTACGPPGSNNNPTLAATAASASNTSGPAVDSSANDTTSGGNTGGPSEAGSSAAATGEPINVGIITSLSGPLQSYGEEYVAALKVGVDYATKGTGAVNGRPVNLKVVDDAADPAKATAAATELVGQSYSVMAGSASSGVALQMAPLAAENKVLFISGPAATDAITGANSYTLRSGRQSYQDTMTAASYLGDLKGNKVTVFARR